MTDAAQTDDHIDVNPMGLDGFEFCEFTSPDPDALRRRLKVHGPHRISVVITRLGAGRDSRAVAYLCRPTH